MNMNRVYVSTSCLKNPKNVLEVLTEYEKAGIENVELGSVHENFDVKKLKEFNFNFLIHNYFPPPKDPFNFNLASQNTEIKKKSVNLAKKAIDLCYKINSPIYTFHAGFTVDPPKLGKAFPRENIPERQKTIETYVKSVKELVSHAKKRGIKIAMEPNVVQKFNLVNNLNKLCLFAEFQEMEILFEYFKKEELGILLDLGHTSVTSHWLKFDKDEFVKQCKSRVFAIHISNNNGLQDQHKSLTKNCWQVSKLEEFKNTPIILETMNLSIQKIKHNIKLVNY
jgi:sugar phosphate isomerase/epimerase